MRPLGGGVLVAEQRHRRGHAEAEQLLRVALARLAHLDQRSRLPSLHTPTDAGGVSNASAIGVRGLCDRGACRVRRPPACDARARGGRAAPRLLVPASLPSQAVGGPGRSWPGAFGRTKNKSGARPAHRARDAARAPRGRRTVQQICVFEAPATQDWRPLVRTDASTE